MSRYIMVVQAHLSCSSVMIVYESRKIVIIWQVSQHKNTRTRAMGWKEQRTRTSFVNSLHMCSRAIFLLTVTFDIKKTFRRVFYALETWEQLLSLLKSLWLKLYLAKSYSVTGHQWFLLLWHLPVWHVYEILSLCTYFYCWKYSSSTLL